MASYFWFFVSLFAPMLAAVGVIWIVRQFDRDKNRKSPVTRKVCRHPGYSLAKRIEDLNDDVGMWLMCLLFVPAVTMGLSGLDYFEAAGAVGRWALGTVYVGGVGLAIFRLVVVGRRLTDARRGLRGEQVVGYQLAELHRHGFHVYHDYPIDHGNIDHVVVGPPGVFAIETKYKRKSKTDKEGHKLGFDAHEIRFPDSRTSEPLEQAARQAKALRKHLDDILGRLPVTPVVVYPGWYVSRLSSEAPVQVMNDVLLLSHLPSLPRMLDDATVRRIALRMEDRCRDVEV